MACDTIVDSFSESYKDIDAQINANFPNDNSALGQCFCTPASPQYKICKAKFYLKRVGNPDGKLEARLYSIKAGRTCGSNAEPPDTPATATPLAISDSVNMSAVGTSYSLVEFAFSGDEQYVMDASECYEIIVVAKDCTNFSGSNYVHVGIDYISPVDDGNGVEISGGNWDDDPYDIIFYVYGEEYVPPLERGPPSSVSIQEIGKPVASIRQVNKPAATIERKDPKATIQKVEE